MDCSALGTTARRARIEFCIDAFVEETGYVASSARAVRDPAELSPSLERCVASMQISAWRAWEERGRIWFIQGRLIETGDAKPDTPLAHLIFRDHRARAIAAGVWCRNAPAQWDLVIALSARFEDATA
jgi:hypothetical protein